MPEPAFSQSQRRKQVYAWLGGGQGVTHPVQQMIDRLAAEGAGDAFDLDFASIRQRVVRIMGALVDVPLGRPDEVEPALRELLSRRSTSSAT